MITDLELDCIASTIPLIEFQETRDIEERLVAQAREANALRHTVGEALAASVDNIRAREAADAEIAKLRAENESLRLRLSSTAEGGYRAAWCFGQTLDRLRNALRDENLDNIDVALGAAIEAACSDQEHQEATAAIDSFNEIRQTLSPTPRASGEEGKDG